jgi:hypothetical protein
MSREARLAKLRAAAWAIAAEDGVSSVIRALDEVKQDIENQQWRPPGR